MKKGIFKCYFSFPLKYLKNIFALDPALLGRNSQNFLHKLLIFVVTLGLKILIIDITMTKSSFKADIIKGDVNYCINHKTLIFFEKLLSKSTLKLKKILQICLRSLVNSHPGL